jgi:hypothetical protein
MRKLVFAITLLGFTIGSVHAKGGWWWKTCSQHWEECKSYYLKWKEQKLQFAQKEVECVKNAKSPSEMNMCLRKVRQERRKAFREWRREFSQKYREWKREEIKHKGKEMFEKPSKEQNEK